MAGVQVELTLQGIEGAARALGQLAEPDIEDLADRAGIILESSTQDRIASEKVAPDGTPWEPWSDRYAKTRKGNHSLLVSSGLENSLLGATQSYTTGTTVRVGNNLVYGAIHQMGGEIENAWGRGISVTMPARPYLGLSAADRDAIEALIADTLTEGFE
ncbi:phage virion morphogenesis protein [Roseinatronobacter sp.]|uniref:phage virion morphogenesis protein n=1 Tax=Roseinatronobacter sp. TaxID=1945755 RepID=UPI0025CEA5A5|nr:phage virion morphogenesis protein [Roseibaca sp.]